MTFRILIPDRAGDLDPVIERQVFEGIGVLDNRTAAVPEDVPDESWAAADAVLVNSRMQMGAYAVARMKRCRIVVRFGAGYDNFDLAALGTAGIPACNVPDYHQGEISDHAMGMLLTLRRGILTYGPALATDWRKGWNFVGAPLMRRLEGSTLGIVGIGRIGRATARRALGFGMDVLFYDPYVAADDPAVAGCRKADSLAALLGASDAVTLHCPLTSETNGLLGAAAIAQMKAGAILINTARGPVADPDAALDALRAGHLGGLALDVLPDEPPLPESRLMHAHRDQPDWARGRLIVTPHAAFFSPESIRDLRRKCAETARDYLQGKALRNCVNERELAGRARR